MDELLTRRGTLLRLGGLAAAALGIEAWKTGDGPAPLRPEPSAAC